MGFAEVLASFVNSPARIYSTIRDTVLPSPGSRKRNREDSTNAQASEVQPRASRPKIDKDWHKNAVRTTADLKHIDGVTAGAQPLQTPLLNGLHPYTSTHQLKPERLPQQSFRLLAAYEAGRYGTKTPAQSNQPQDRQLAKAPTPLLYQSVAPRRHGPYSSFRRNFPAQTATPPKVGACLHLSFSVFQIRCLLTVHKILTIGQ
jgi:hypothetical protein